MGKYDTGPSIGLHPGSDGGMNGGSDAEKILRIDEDSPLGGCIGTMPEDAAVGKMHAGALEGWGVWFGGGNFMQLVLEWCME